MILGVDIDDTIAGWTAAMQASMWSRFNFDFVGHLSMTCYMDRSTPQHVLESVKNIGTTEHFYEGLLPIPGAKEAILSFIPTLSEIFYITHRQPKSKDVTEEWLKRWGFPVYDNIIFDTGSKHIAIKKLCITHYVDDRWECVYTLQHMDIDAYLLLAYPSHFQRTFPYDRFNGATTWEGIRRLIMKDLGHEHDEREDATSRYISTEDGASTGLGASTPTDSPT